MVGKRTEKISARISAENKLILEKMKKENNISLGDILEQVCKNTIQEQNMILLKKMEVKKAKLEILNREFKETLDKLNRLEAEIQVTTQELDKLDAIKNKDNKIFSEDMNLKIRDVLISVFEIKERHTNVFGEVSQDYDAYRSIESICAARGVDSDVVHHVYDMVDNGSLTLESVLNEKCDYNEIIGVEGK